jgi:hypothetical protein
MEVPSSHSRGGFERPATEATHWLRAPLWDCNVVRRSLRRPAASLAIGGRPGWRLSFDDSSESRTTESTQGHDCPTASPNGLLEFPGRVRQYSYHPGGRVPRWPPPGGGRRALPTICVHSCSVAAASTYGSGTGLIFAGSASCFGSLMWGVTWQA